MGSTCSCFKWVDILVKLQLLLPVNIILHSTVNIKVKLSPKNFEKEVIWNINTESYLFQVYTNVE